MPNWSPSLTHLDEDHDGSLSGEVEEITVRESGSWDMDAAVLLLGMLN